MTNNKKDRQLIRDIFEIEVYNDCDYVHFDTNLLTFETLLNQYHELKKERDEKGR